MSHFVYGGGWRRHIAEMPDIVVEVGNGALICMSSLTDTPAALLCTFWFVILR